MARTGSSFWRLATMMAAAFILPAGGCGTSKAASGGPLIPSFVVAGGGGLKITAHGGSGSAGSGGVGGAITITGQSGSDLNVLNDPSTVATSFTVPNFSVNFGANVRTISNPVAFATTNTAPFAIPGDAAGNATGLHITSTGKLTLTGLSGTTAMLWFTNGVQIDAGGSLVLDFIPATNNVFNLDLECADLVLQAGATITGTGFAGGSGGGNAGGTGSIIQLTSNGNVVIAGTVNLTGGSTALAGSGGGGGAFLLVPESIIFPASNPTQFSSFYLTGTITTNGGASTGAVQVGGNAGVVAIQTFGGPDVGHGAFVNGIINTVGGAGTSNGGNGGLVQFSLGGNKSASSLVVAGTITTTGGAATSAGNGGNAGNIMLTNGGYNLLSSATLVGSGGNGAGGGNGGTGAAVVFSSVNNVSPGALFPDQIVSGGMAIAGSITVNGGDGALGGAAGSIAVLEDQTDAPAGLNPVNIVGYSLFDTLGGSGTTVAGAGGAITIQQKVHINQHGNFTQGSIQNTVALSTRGGAGVTNGGGGAGGTVAIGTQAVSALGTIPACTLAQANTNDQARSVENQGAITTTGGAGLGSGNGGSAGDVGLQDFFSATNSGVITANGGDGGTTGQGGVGANLIVRSQTSATNTGAVTANGGNGALGGQGGGLSVNTAFDAVDSSTSSIVLNSGTFTANGGTGSTGAGGQGGVMTVAGNNQVTNTGNVVLIGGGGVNGGNGGSMHVLNTSAYYTDTASVTNSGSLAAAGGAGSAGSGGTGGGMFIVGHASATNTGGNTSNGGAGSGGGIGGSGGTVFCGAAGTASNAGTFFLSGALASGTGGGGNGGNCSVSGHSASHNGNVTANGGNGAAVFGAGDGGLIFITSTVGTSVMHGAMSVQAGSGPQALVGNVMVDGVDQPLPGPPVGTGNF